MHFENKYNIEIHLRDGRITNLEGVNILPLDQYTNYLTDLINKTDQEFVTLLSKDKTLVISKYEIVFLNVIKVG